MTNRDSNASLLVTKQGARLGVATGQSTQYPATLSPYEFAATGLDGQNESLKLQLSGFVFTGITASTEPYTASEILALGRRIRQGTTNVSYTLSPVNQYIVHAWPEFMGALDDLEFYIGDLGLPGDMQEVQTGLIIKGRRYRVARSDNLLDATLAGGTIPFEVI